MRATEHQDERPFHSIRCTFIMPVGTEKSPPMMPFPYTSPQLKPRLSKWLRSVRKSDYYCSLCWLVAYGMIWAGGVSWIASQSAWGGLPLGSIYLL